MTTFQAIIYAIIRGFTDFLPLDWSAHREIASYFTRWPAPSAQLEGGLALAGFLALLFYFIHDWASMISCFIQVVLFRKKPMTLDERLPFFLAIATVPLLLAGGLIRELLGLEWPPIFIAISLAAFGLLLKFSESMGRRNRGMFDWNWIDALLVGLLQLATVLVGLGSITATWIVALFRGYNREASAKFAFYTLAPVLLADAVRGLRGLSFHDAEPMADVSWFTFSIAILVTFFTALLVVGGTMKQVQNKGVSQYTTYRCLLAVVLAAVYWLRSR